MTILPNEYQEVEWIQADGNQTVIITNIIPTNNTKLILDFFADNYDGNVLFGTTKGSQGFKSYTATIYNNSLSIGLSNTMATDLSSSSYPYTTGRHLLTFNNIGNFSLDNQWTYTNTTDINYGIYYLTLFSRQDKAQIGTMKLYNCKVYENNVLTNEFIPCYRISDNRTGVYDIINNQFIDNVFGNEFIKGPDVISSRPIYFNITQCSKVFFNGAELQGAKFNGNNLF